MLDLLKKIGIPATVAAVIASLVTMVPVLFKVDERYAKADDMKAAVSKLEKTNEELRHELAQTVGFQQAMVQLIQQGRGPVHPTTFEYDVPSENGGFMRVQYVVKPVQAASAASAASAPASAASATVQTTVRRMEKPMNWKELSDGLMRQQQRLIKD